MTNRPKGKLFALLAIFAAIGIVTATGAFTSVQAERTMDISVVGDASANLALTDAGNGYVDTSGNQISLSFNEVNIRADTDFGAVLDITNNGPNQVYVQIATKASQTSYTSSDLFEDANSINPQFLDGPNGANIEGGDVDSGGSQLTIASGNTATVYVTLSVGSITPTSFSGNIVIEANTNDLTN
ncbi:MAG: hypothetical protein ABEH59_02465 [Halobacteriales archaeon]